MDQFSKDQQTKFEAVWNPQGHGNYRLGSPGARLVKRFMQYAPPGCVVNDYGAGTGRASVALWAAGYRVNMVEIAGNALEAEALASLGEGLNWIQASIWVLPAKFPKANWGYCIEVLMTLPAERLDQAVREIRRTCRNLFVQVADWSDRRLGMEFNTIRMDAESWQTKLLEHWNTVERLLSEEDYRRYIFVCRGE